MYCNKCGAQIADGIAFCPKCGAKQNIQAGQEAGVQSGAAAFVRESPRENPSAGQVPGRKKVSSGVIFGIAAGGLAAVAAVVGLVVWLTAGSGENGESGNIIESVAGTIAGGETPDSAGDSEISGEDTPQTPLYSIPDVAWVDLTVGNHALGTKQPGMTWDSTLFYWLEDIDTGSAEDGYIARCRVSKTLLRDAQSQQLRQYEIYSDPENGAVYKIVSIEPVEGGLALVDYYYRDGRPDFIFSRGDTVYTPTYATPSKVGERYYFNSEVMVRWRMIREPGVIGEYVLSPQEVSYSQGDYYAENDELRRIYDEVELRMFNAAYNTYDAVIAGGNVGLVQGALRDTLGNGIADRAVRLYRESDGVLLYEAVTDADGQYCFFVNLDDTACYLKVEGDELYRETLVQGIQLLPSNVNYSYGLTMHKNSGDEYPVTLHAYSCMDVTSDENGTVCGMPIQAVTATVREGAGNYSGEGVRTVETQSGELTTNLPPGTYTVQFHAEGYLDHYMEVEVSEEAAVRDAYIMPGLGENQTGVILTWDSDEVDLDLTLFTPYQAENGDMDHIGGNVDWDGRGNILVSDNGSRCEAMFINSGEQGSYKLFVNNYTDSAAGNYTSDALYRVNAHVYIYNCDGFVAEYTMPLGQSGVVWEVVEVNGRTVTPAQRVYTEISGKSWWTGSKEVWNPEEDAALLANLQSEDSDLRNLMEALVHTLSVEKINSLLRGEDVLNILFSDGDMPPAVYINQVCENSVNWHDELYDRLYEQLGNEYYLTEEQTQYIIYSICGKWVDINFNDYSRKIEPYIGFGSAAGDISRDDLEYFSVERVNASTWNVRAYDLYSCDWEPTRILSRVCFTVVKNPDSCFDGYSLTGFEVEEEAPTDWAQTYYDYLTTDPEGIALMEERYGSGWQEGTYEYGLIYVNNDMVPELYLQGLDYARGDILLYLNNNGVQPPEYFSNFGGRYIPYTGLINNENGHSGGVWADNYRLENGQLTEIGGWYGHWSDIDMETGYPIEVAPDEPIVEIIDSCQLNGNEVTQEQYQETIDALVGTGEFQSCASTQYTGVLEMLENILW